MKHFASILPLLTAVTASCIHDDGLELRDNNPVHAGTFNYTGLGGPLNWYGLDKKQNGLCAKGRYQSPINIDSGIHTAARGISMQIPTDIGEFENLGYTIEVTQVKGSLFTPNGRYTLHQFHFHTPSEHRINEEYYPLEVHFVFKNPGM